MAEGTRTSGDDEARASAVPPPPATLFRPLRGIVLAALVLVAFVAAVPSVRAWAFRVLWLPVVADVLGRPLVVDGAAVEAMFPPQVQVAMAILFVALVLAARAWLMERRASGALWAQRLKIDTSLLLAVTPFMALGAVWNALEAAQLYPVPWAFLHVPPFIYLTLTVLVVGCLLLALYVERPMYLRLRVSAPVRFLLVLALLLGARVAYVDVLGATVRSVPWWGHLIPTVAAYGVFYATTLGHRMVSHRRALFAIGTEQLVFGIMFLTLWIVDGPWQGLEWSYLGHEAVRDTGRAVPTLGWIAVLIPIGFTYGIYTLGSFLHTYVRPLRPWTDGLNLAMVFGQILDAWVVTVGVNGTFGAPGPRWEAGRYPGFLVHTLGGWGYLVAKVVFVLFLVQLLDRMWQPTSGRQTELAKILKGAVLALGLVPGVRGAVRLVLGF